MDINVHEGYFSQFAARVNKYELRPEPKRPPAAYVVLGPRRAQGTHAGMLRARPGSGRRSAGVARGAIVLGALVLGLVGMPGALATTQEHSLFDDDDGGAQVRSRAESVGRRVYIFCYSEISTPVPR